MASEFVIFQEYIERLRGIYFNALSAFYDYEAIEELRAPNILGDKEAENNVAVLSRFKDFFVVARHTLSFYFLMELAKILDDHKDNPISLNLLIRYAKNHKDRFTADEFEKYNPGRKELKYLKSRYIGLTDDDLVEIGGKLKTIDTQKKILKTIRDKILAHEDRIKPEVYVRETDIVAIFDVVAEILNIFSDRTNFSTANYSRVESDCKRSTKNVVEYLKRFEQYRLKEIEKMVLGRQE